MAPPAPPARAVRSKIIDGRRKDWSRPSLGAAPAALSVGSRLHVGRLVGTKPRAAMSSQPEAKRQRIEQQEHDTTTQGDAMAEETSGGKMEAEATAEGEFSFGGGHINNGYGRNGVSSFLAADREVTGGSKDVCCDCFCAYYFRSTYVLYSRSISLMRSLQSTRSCTRASCT